MTNLLRPVFALMLAATLIGCQGCAPSNAALKNHSIAAQTVDDVATEAREMVLELRETELTEAAAQAKADGGDPVDIKLAVERAAATFDAGPAIPAVNAFIAAKDLYVRTVLATASKDKPTWSEAKAMLKDVVDAYANLRHALGDPEKMPPLPDVIAKLLTRAATPWREPGAEAVS